MPAPYPMPPDQRKKSFWSKVKKTKTCWLWTGGLVCTKRPGYGYGKLKVDGKPMMAHRYAWLLAHGSLPPTLPKTSSTLYVLHKCDTPLCVRPSHLFLGTQRQNLKDARDKGRHARGERNGHAKITEKDVRRIRKLYAQGKRTYVAFAKEYGLHPGSVQQIVERRTWKHID